jgi:O-antigen ligase
VELERFVLFLVLGATIVPASLAQPAGTNIAGVDLLMLVALAAWLINNSLRNAPSPRLADNPILLPAILFVAANWVTVAWSVHLHTTVTKGIQLVELFVIFLVVFSSLPSSVKNIRNGLTFLVGMTFLLAMATLVLWTIHPSARTQGTYLPGFNKNAIGSFLAAGLVLAYGLHRSERGAFREPFLLMAMVVDLLGLLASGSRGAMLGAAAGVLAVSLLLKRGKIVAIALLTLLVALYVAVVAPGITQKTSLPGSYDTTSLRVHIWKDAIHTIEKHPILGTGGGTYYDVQYGQGDPSNLFLLTWAEIGIPGMAALIYFLISFGRLLLRSRHLQDEHAILAIAAGGVVVSILVHSQVDVSWTRGTYSMAFAMIGIMVALARLSPQRAIVPGVDARLAAQTRDTPSLLGSAHA